MACVMKSSSGVMKPPFTLHLMGRATHHFIQTLLSMNYNSNQEHFFSCEVIEAKSGQLVLFVTKAWNLNMLDTHAHTHFLPTRARKRLNWHQRKDEEKKFNQQG